MTILPQDIIRQKRDGGTLSNDQIIQFITAVTDGSFSDSQTAAMAMAIFLNGMNARETATLTLAMRDSGHVLRWPEIDGPIIDKHSTGGVGDNVSLMLAPLAAACGLTVPMISGRGLGHTGGTLDKLEAIHGYQVSPSETVFRQTVKKVGCAIISASHNFAPADKKIYAIRDVTATVESNPLIVASILSKKLASGLDGLILDVKCGNGATTSSISEAQSLARSMVDVAYQAGMTCSAMITDMNEPLANAIGNATEVQNAIDFLTGHAQTQRLKTIVIDLVARMIIAGNLADTMERARALALNNLDSGKAAEIFAQMVAALGGPLDILKQPARHLPQAAIKRPIIAPCDGYVQSYDTRALGMAIVRLGGGRAHPNDQLDYAVGLSNLLPIGTHVNKGDELALAHTASDAQCQQIIRDFDRIITLSDHAPEIADPIVTHID